MPEMVLPLFQAATLRILQLHDITIDDGWITILHADWMIIHPACWLDN